MVVNKWVFLLAVVLIIGCSNSNLTGKSVSSIAPKEENTFLEVYFCQVEDCNSYLMELINNSNNSVHCALFDLDLNDTIKLFGSKSKSIDVKLVIDNENDNNPIKGPGVRFDTSSQFSHNKFCIFDNEIVLTGSFNPTDRGNNKNDNNIVIIGGSNYIVENYNYEFNELWDGEFGSGEDVKNPVVYLGNMRVENYFCPEDKCSEKIIDVISKAKESIYFMTFSFTHEKIADAILFKDVKIKGIFEKSQGGSKYSQFWRFEGFKVDVIKDKNPYNMHHKVFIIDEKIVVTGSFNPSSNADRNNDENILIIYDKEIARRYLDEFERVWNLE